jgi:hypothetical protein
MKKIVVILLFAVSVAGAQTTAKAHAEIGYAPEARATYFGDYDKTLYTELGVTVPVFTYGFIEGSVSTLFTMHGVKGHPFSDAYVIGAGVCIGNITVGVKHECVHPVFSNGLLLVPDYAGGGFTKIYARYDMEF